MEPINKFTEFYNNPYSMELTRNFGLIANFSVTSLLGLMQTINEITKSDDESKQSIDYCTNLIESICGKLQRTGIFCSAIINEPPDQRLLQSEKYLTAFVSGCSRVLPEKYTVIASDIEDFTFESSSELLDLLLLGFLRKLCASEAFTKTDEDTPTVFEVSAIVKNGIPQIRVISDANTSQKNSTSSGTQDFFESFFDEFASLVSKKLNIEVEISPSYMLVNFIHNQHNDSLHFESEKPQLACEERNLFRIMLDDI